jgi:hypothetical protein
MVDEEDAMTNESVSKGKIEPEPKWEVLTLPTLRRAASEVLGVKPKKRTLRTAYEEVLAELRGGDRDLTFTCQECGSLIDDVMLRCWACGLVFSDDVAAEEPSVADDELAVRAERLGIDPAGLDREDLLKRIEDAETRARASKVDADLLLLESRRLNEHLTEAMPDGWSKKRSKQYTTYFDADGTRRIAVFHRGLRVDFSVDDGFLDGFPNVEFFDRDERRRRHFGRTNYVYSGETFKTGFDLAKRVFARYQAK